VQQQVALAIGAPAALGPAGEGRAHRPVDGIPAEAGQPHQRGLQVGGQGSGRKFPILFAGRLLGDSQKLNIGVTHPSGFFGNNHPNNRSQFGEDCQTFYVQQTSPGVYNWGYGGYDASWLGRAEWGNGHTHMPNLDNSNWNHDSYRRCCTANAWNASVLVARVMGLRDEWNHQALFDYTDRFALIEPVGWTRSWSAWVGRMWDLYRPQY